MKKKTKKAIFVTIIVVLVIVAGIIAYVKLFNPQLHAPLEYGIVRIQMIDAPTNLNISHVYVNISGVRVHYDGNSNTLNQSDFNSSDIGWKSVNENSVFVDLIQLRIDNESKLLGETPLKMGQYSQIRLSVDSAVIVADNATHPLIIPSGEVKLIKGFNIEEGKLLILTLDFDANESIHESGNGYLMNPVIKLVSS